MKPPKTRCYGCRKDTYTKTKLKLVWSAQYGAKRQEYFACVECGCEKAK